MTGRADRRPRRHPGHGSPAHAAGAVRRIGPGARRGPRLDRSHGASLMRRPWSFVIRHSSFVIHPSSLVLCLGLLAAAGRPVPGPPGTGGKRSAEAGRAAVGGRSVTALSRRDWRRCGDEEAHGPHGDRFLRDQRPGMKGDLKVVAQAPDRDAPVDHAARHRQHRGRAIDGSIGWSIDPAVGPRLLEGKELDQLEYAADFYQEPARPGQTYSSMTVVSRGPFEGEDCYEVEAGCGPRASS